jgi:hypothetical protein
MECVFLLVIYHTTEFLDYKANDLLLIDIFKYVI